jgi:NADH dehydrogenase FAD-containing subunit
LDEIYEKVKSAKSVLVAGGGIVGCEVVGELLYTYGNEKKIGICLKGEKLVH